MIALGASLYLVAVRSRLPIEVATHWNGDGVADGFTSRDTLPWLAAVLSLVSGLPITLIALVASTSPLMPRWLSGLGGGIVAFVAAIFLFTAQAQLDTEEIIEFPGWVIGLATVAGLAVTALGAVLTPPPESLPATTDPAPADALRHPLAEGATAVWTGRTPFGMAMVIATLLTTMLFLVLAAFTSWWMLAMLLVLALVLIGSTSFAVTAGPAGVRVAGIFGFPRVTVPLAEITAAEAGTIRAMQFGGWGYKINLAGDSAVITQSGSALVLHRTDGKRFLVSLDRPEQPAALLSTLMDRRA